MDRKSKNNWNGFWFYSGKKISFVIDNLLKAGMHNVRPAVQMWPVDAFNLACQGLNFVLLAFF